MYGLLVGWIDAVKDHLITTGDASVRKYVERLDNYGASIEQGCDINTAESAAECVCKAIKRHIADPSKVANKMCSYLDKLRGWGIEEGEFRVRVYLDDVTIECETCEGYGDFIQDCRGFWGMSSVHVEMEGDDAIEVANDMVEAMLERLHEDLVHGA